MKTFGTIVAIFVAFNCGMMAGNLLAFTPRLVGYGCENAAGPLFAMEESDFPRCQAIEGTYKIYEGNE